MELLLSVCRYSCGLLFLIAAISKITKFKNFRSNLTESFVVSESLSTLLALAITAAELSLALWLLLATGSAKLAMELGLILMLIFSLVLILTYWFRGPVKCNCFGEQHRTFSVADLARNLIIVCGMSLYLVLPELQLGHAMSLPVMALALALTIVLIHLHEAVELLVRRSNYE